MRQTGSGICAAVLCVISVLPVRGQSVRSLVNDGNGLYKEEKYTDAEVNYRKALQKERELVQGHFNLGNALHKQGKFDEAVNEYENALQRAEQKDTKAYAYYNIGNSQVREQKLQDAVQSYTNALKLNPSDEDAKYNLSYVLRMLQQQQQQKKNQQKQDKNKEDRQDQSDQQQKKDDQRKQDQEKQDRQQQMQRQQKQISKADAERILEVLKNNEKEVQKKLRMRQAVRPKTDKDW